jgi:hypothetical protein
VEVKQIITAEEKQILTVEVKQIITVEVMAKLTIKRRKGVVEEEKGPEDEHRNKINSQKSRLHHNIQNIQMNHHHFTYQT